jgi:hypothetical protein
VKARAMPSLQNPLTVAGGTAPAEDKTKHLKLLCTTGTGTGKGIVMREILHAALQRDDCTIITHNLQGPNNFATGGAWFDDYGRVICVWQWDAKTKALAVTCGSRGRRIGLSGVDPKSLDAELLRKRLPRLALEAAEKINGTRYEF